MIYSNSMIYGTYGFIIISVLDIGRITKSYPMSHAVSIDFCSQTAKQGLLRNFYGEDNQS